MAKQDLNSKFRRSYFGFSWLILQQLVFAFGAGFLWASIFGLKPGEFIPSITIGFALWGFIVASFVEGSSSFITSAGYIKQIALPLNVYIGRIMALNLTILAIAFSVAILVAILFGAFHPIGILKVLPGLALLILCMFGTMRFFGIVGARFRDVPHGLGSLFQMLFVVTPIIYPASILEDRGLGWALHINPFSSLIEVVRRPLLTGEFADPYHYIVTIILTILAISVSSYLFKKLQHNVVYWL
jgi:ABC-type polysaccharide/polyol phosphate export permease